MCTLLALAWGLFGPTLPEALAANIAPSATLSVDSTNGTYTKDKAVDGIKNDSNSRWVSANTAEPHWFQLDWTTNKTINNVKVWSGASTGPGWQIYSYKIQYWNGSAWTDISGASVTSNTQDGYAGQFNNLSFSAVTTNKIRMYITDGTSQAGYTDARLLEIEVWDPGAIVVDATAAPVVVSSFGGFGAEWDTAGYVANSIDATKFANISYRAGWMRLPFIRVEMLARWVLPSGVGGGYNFSTTEMQKLYMVLDYAQANGVTVFLMDWGINQTWNSVTGITNEADLDYAATIGTYMNHLKVTKGYSGIKYFGTVNEPNFEASSFTNWKTGVQNVYNELNSRGLLTSLSFVGSDESNNEQWHRDAVDQLQAQLKAYDLHRYETVTTIDAGALESFLKTQWDYALNNDAAAGTKPFVVGEAGLAGGTASSHPNINTFDYGLSMADYGIQAGRAGAHIVSAWQLSDDSHTGFNWGMMDDSVGAYALRLWYYPWSLMSKYVPVAAILYKVTQPSGVRVLAAKSGSDWTFLIVNMNSTAADLLLKAPDVATKTFKRFLYSPASQPIDANGNPTPASTVTGNLTAGISATVPVDSFVVVTSVDRGADPSPPSTATNLAPSATLSVDSTNGTYTKDKGVDGIKNDSNSRWISTNTAEPHWFQLDWASNKVINNVKVWSGASTGPGWQIYSYKMQSWNGSAWADIAGASVTNNTQDGYVSQFNNLSFTAVTTNKIRMYITDGTSQAGFTDARLLEIEVWGN